MQKQPVSKSPTAALLTVSDNCQLTPAMRRITLHGSELAEYPEIISSLYVKLLFDFNNNPETSVPKSTDNSQMRTYTIRHIDHQNCTMIIDMVLHGDEKDSGPASHWAAHALPGDKIAVAGPGRSKELPERYDWVLLVGDMTALPAIASYLERLPPATIGYAVIDIHSEADKQALHKPSGVTLKWISDDTTTLAQAVSDITWLSGTPAIWAACEFSQMRQLRTLFTNDYAISHQQLYISSYWRKGRSEDQHKIDKRKDSQAFAATQIR